jgi:hypothetical protein
MALTRLRAILPTCLQEKYERGGEGNERVRDARKGVAGIKDQMNRNAEVRH